MRFKDLTILTALLNCLLIVNGQQISSVSIGRNSASRLLEKIWPSQSPVEMRTAQTPAEDKLFFPPYVFPFWGLPYGMYSNGGFFNPGLFPFVPGGPGFPPYDGIFGGPFGPGTFPGPGPTPFKYPPYETPKGASGDKGSGKKKGKKGKGKKSKGKKESAQYTEMTTEAPAAPETPYKPKCKKACKTKSAPTYPNQYPTRTEEYVPRPSTTPQQPQPYKKPCHYKQRCPSKGRNYGNSVPGSYAQAPPPTSAHSQTNNYANSYYMPPSPPSPMAPYNAALHQQTNSGYNNNYPAYSVQPAAYSSNPPQPPQMVPSTNEYNNPQPPQMYPQPAVYNNPQPPQMYPQPAVYNNPQPPQMYSQPAVYNNPQPPTYTAPEPSTPQMYNNYSPQHQPMPPPPATYNNPQPPNSKYPAQAPPTNSYPPENVYAPSLPPPPPFMSMIPAQQSYEQPPPPPATYGDEYSPTSYQNGNMHIPSIQNPPATNYYHQDKENNNYASLMQENQSQQYTYAASPGGASTFYSETNEDETMNSPTTVVPVYQESYQYSDFSVSSNGPSSSTNANYQVNNGNKHQFTVEHDFDIGNNYQLHNVSITSTPIHENKFGWRPTPVYVRPPPLSPVNVNYGNQAPSKTDKSQINYSPTQSSLNTTLNYGPPDPTLYYTSVVTNNNTGLLYTPYKRR